MDELRTLGKYELRGVLGKGASGTVYDGWDPAIARRVAIKAVDLPGEPDDETLEQIARFRREAQAAGQLNHPNIVAIYDYGETSDLAYIVMEFVDGPTLKVPLDGHERFALSDIQRIMDDVLAGLQFSHERGVVHRDIKPANIMLTSERRAKIADFGIARIEMSNMTQAGTMLGTPAYMSPEQFMGEVVDARSDIYAAGVVLYQLLTGDRPFDGGVSAIMHKVLNTDPPAPSEIAVTVPTAMDAVVKRALAKRPDDRYPSAAIFAEAIRGAITPPPRTEEHGLEPTIVRPARPGPTARATALPSTPRNTAPPGDSSPRRSIMPMMLMGAGVAAIVGLGAGGWFLFGHPSETSPRPPPSAVSAGGDLVPAPREALAAPARVSVRTSASSGTSDQAPGSPTTTAAHPETPWNTTAATGSTATDARTPASPQPSVHATRTEQTDAAALQAPPSQTPAAAAPNPPVPAPAAPATLPAPQQVAIDFGAAHRLIGQALARSTCALGTSVLQDDGVVTVSGYTSAAALSALRQELTAVPGALPTWRMREVDPVFCTALNLLRPIATQGGAPMSGLAVTLANGVTALRDGEHILPRVTMADFAGEVRVDYLGHDGSVAHLYPTAADPTGNVIARPSRQLQPGEPLSIGEPGPGQPTWVAGPPYGTDMIMVVASSSPLVLHTPTLNAEDHAAAYLRELESAITQVRHAGGRVAGTLLLLDTRPK